MAGTIKHSWNGTVLTISSDSGTSSCDLKGEKGDDGARGAQGQPGGTCFEVSQAANNILDNSYFPSIFVINQRGETTHTGTGYSIDRWRVYHADTTHTLTAAGISVSGNTPNMYQVIEPHKIDTNKIYTAAAMDIEGNIYLKAAKPTTTGYAGACLYINGNDYLFRLNGAKTWVWAALYEGEYTKETLPAYQYKGYAAELAECQRYYYQSWNGTTPDASGVLTRTAFAASRLLNVELPQTMRVVPTITIYSSRGEIGTIRDYLTGNSIVSNMGVFYSNTKSFIPGNNTSGLTVNTVYCFHYTASADL